MRPRSARGFTLKKLCTTDAVASVWQSFQTSPGDLLVAILAEAEGPLLDASQCVLDLDQKLSVVLQQVEV
jgi:hypothetical protein